MANANVQLWFQFGTLKRDIKKAGRRFIAPEEIIEVFSLSEPANSLVLEAKKKSETQYTVLASDYLSKNNFSSVSEEFDIAWGNPIIVTKKASEAVSVETEAVSVETETVSVETETVSVETEAVSVETEAVSVETEAVSVETEAVSVETEAVSVETEVVSVETEAVSVETEAVSVETEAVSVETKAVSVGASTMATQSQIRSNEIWVCVRHNVQQPIYFSFKRATLDDLEVFDVNGLIENVKLKLKRIMEKVSEKVSKKVSEKAIILRKGGKDLNLKTPISELYNTKNEALEVIIDELTDKMSKLAIRENDIEPNRIEEAFQIEYKGTTLDTFFSRLRYFHDEWYREKSYAPYLTIIQNSGSGKTRLVGELSTKNIYVLYICKRCETNTGYPASTPYAHNIFETIRENKFSTLLSLAIKQIKVKGWDANLFWRIQVMAEYKSTCEEFWKGVFESLSSQTLLECSNKGFVTNLFPSGDISVVCCIDEAHELLEKKHGDGETYFVRWRRQIQNIGWHRFFNILLSTNGKIGNFLPPVTEDATSAKSYDFELFPVFLDVHTMDILASFAGNDNKDYNPKRTVYLGIPLWGSLAQAKVSLAEISRLASLKIRNFIKTNDYLANFACMACSLALEISPRIAEVDDLIASHMATAIGVSLNRTHILSTYPSDPILAHGALKGIIDTGWENCLSTLLAQFSHGVVEAGERGELVNRIIFLEAYTDAIKNCFSADLPAPYLQKVPLKSFLHSLFHDKINGLDELLEELNIEEAEIGFNHWTALLATNQDYVDSGGNKYLTEDLVIEAYHRHTAFKMPIGFYNIDHIIPFKCPSGYGIISIQNKNAKKTTFNNTIDITSLVDPKSAFGVKVDGYRVLGIYIDLGVDNLAVNVKDKGVMQLQSHGEKSQKPKRVVHVQGISSFRCCENDEIYKRLSKILFTRPWPLDDQWSCINKKKHLERKNEIKSFLPLVFNQENPLVEKWNLK